MFPLAYNLFYARLCFIILLGAVFKMVSYTRRDWRVWGCFSSDYAFAFSFIFPS